MKLYAIEIRKNSLELVTLLNQGVTPHVDKKRTWLLIDAEWNSEVPNKILTERELGQNYDLYATSPLVLRLKS